MDQTVASIEENRTGRAFAVAAPHDWDGIGQALRAAYRDHHNTPCELSDILHELDGID